MVAPTEINIVEPITLGTYGPKSRAFVSPFLVDGKVIKDTGKARLIAGRNSKGEYVQGWIPNFWIKDHYTIKQGTTLIIHWLNRDEFDEKSKPYTNQ